MEPNSKEAVLEAILLELEEKGYQECSLPVAARIAGVDVEEARAEFIDEDSCLDAAYSQICSEIISLARTGCDPNWTWSRQVYTGLCEVLEMLAERPRIAVVLTRGFPAIGPHAYRRYTELLSTLAGLVRDGRDSSRVTDGLPSELEMLAVGAAESLIFAEIDAGRAVQLPAMAPEILFSMLVPFVGPDRATEEMHEAAGAL